MFFERFPNEIIDKILMYLNLESLVNLRVVQYFRLRVGKIIEEKMIYFNWYLNIYSLRSERTNNIKFINVSEEEITDISEITIGYCRIKHHKNSNLFKQLEEDYFNLLRTFINEEFHYYLYHTHSSENDKDQPFIIFKKYKDFGEFLNELKSILN